MNYRPGQDQRKTSPTYSHRYQCILSFNSFIVPHGIWNIDIDRVYNWAQKISILLIGTSLEFRIPAQLIDEYLIKGISKNSDFFVRVRKPRAENRSVYGIHEDSSTELTPLSRKKCIFRDALNLYLTIMQIVIREIISNQG